MIETSNTRLLYNKLEYANRLLKNSKNREERVALTNYIGNVYSSINLVGDCHLIPNKKRVFGNDKNYQKFLKKLDDYEESLLRNFILKKEFHQQFLWDTLVGVEDNLVSIGDGELSPTTSLSETDFYSIFFDFMKNFHLESIFDQYIKENRIYTTNREEQDTTLGFTLYNPVNKDSDIFVGNFCYDIHSMFTLAHEFGHIYDLSQFQEDTKKYNYFFYQSFFGETISKVFERLFLDYMIQNEILLEESKDKLFESTVVNHDYLLSSYILSLLPKEYIEHSFYTHLTEEDIVEIVKGYFLNKETVLDFLKNNPGLDISESYNYTYGDILSIFFKGVIWEEGFSNDMLDEFMRIRWQLFSEDFLEKWDISPKQYVKLHKKEMKILKK